MTPASPPTISPVLRRRLLLLAGLLFALWASWEVSHEAAVDKTVTERTAPARQRLVGQATSAVPDFKLEWPARTAQRQPVADLFSLPIPASAPLAALSAPRAVPVLALKYIGQLDGSDNKHVFLADAQDRVISAKVGEAIGDGWQLTVANEKYLVLRHIATGHEQTISTGASQ